LPHGNEISFRKLKEKKKEKVVEKKLNFSNIILT